MTTCASFLHYALVVVKTSETKEHWSNGHSDNLATIFVIYCNALVSKFFDNEKSSKIEIDKYH